MKKIWHGLVRYWKETDKILLFLCLVCSVYSIVLMCGIHHSDMATVRAVQMQIITSAMGLVAAVVISSFIEIVETVLPGLHWACHVDLLFW